MRARIFRRQGVDKYSFAGELDVADADDAWRHFQGQEPLAEGDIVYVGDQYLELIGDGGWRALTPGDRTRELYLLATEAKPGP
jgi:hypothetical protein